MSVKSYSPDKVTIIFGGAIIQGFADGTFVTVARDNPMFNSGTGADGEGFRAKSNDQSGTITITLLQTSLSNDALSALHALDEATGDGVSPFLMKDNSPIGRTICSAETAWIEKYSDVEYAREVTNREWVIKTDKLNMFVGGN
jgi:hypothetical protein